MRRRQREGFLVRDLDIKKDIFIPRYYDPDIEADLTNLQERYDLYCLSDLVASGMISHSHGDYVPKIYYGTGNYPYLRTSDLANWEIKATPKHGVPKSVYDEYAPSQNVLPGDILFVHEGTYLIGTVAMVTEFEGPVLYQHHLAKFRVNEHAPFDGNFLLAAFESPIVHRQIRSKQFSADIIDSVVGRLEEIFIPVPKDKAELRATQAKVKEAITERAKLRQKISRAAIELDHWLHGDQGITVDDIFSWEPDPEKYREATFLGGRRAFTATVLKDEELVDNILIPKYYDPWVSERSNRYEERCDIRTVGDLVESGAISISTGDEIGRLNYGTGKIPFVRTSDFGSWELKRESKQGVSEVVYNEWAGVQDVKPLDILVVRDGTYLVGTSVLVVSEDMPLLYCGGIFKITCNSSEIDPGLLFALLNLPFVKRQIRNKQFTRDVIDTLGHRLLELKLPVPKDKSLRGKIATFFKESIGSRAKYRTTLDQITANLYTI